jgi:patatin-like phospholipase/acyl hydrolase
MIAGTSSGGLITAMITTPNGDTVKDQPVPTCSAEEVVKFFRQDADKIFPEKFT